MRHPAVSAAEPMEAELPEAVGTCSAHGTVTFCSGVPVSLVFHTVAWYLRAGPSRNAWFGRPRGKDLPPSFQNNVTICAAAARGCVIGVVMSCKLGETRPPSRTFRDIFCCTPGTFRCKALSGLTDKEREQLEALEELPALERRLERIETKLVKDRRCPGWDKQAEALGISECLSMLQQSTAGTDHRRALKAMNIDDMQVGSNWHSPSTCLPSCMANPTELLEYGKRHKERIEAEYKVLTLREVRDDVMAAGTLETGGEDQQCEPFLVMKAGKTTRCTASMLLCRVVLAVMEIL